MKPRILVVEDEVSISRPLVAALEREGFEPRVAATGAEARRALDERPDLILLDLMLPDIDGKDLLREIGRRAPVIVVTARGDELDRVLGLELGADDYVVKPFSGGELVARIRAVLRRRRLGAGDGGGPMTIGSVHLDPAGRTATRDGRPLHLSAREFDLLRLLMASAGRVVPREEIMDRLWGEDWFGSTKSLDVHVSWLRSKIEETPGAPRYLLTVRGIGYRFAALEELESA